MKLYKSPTGEVFAYEEDGSQDSIIPSDFVAMTQDEVVQRDTAMRIQNCKGHAKALIAAADWAVLPDVGLANVSDFTAYRATLRALILNPVADPVFPTEPQPVWE